MKIRFGLCLLVSLMVVSFVTLGADDPGKVGADVNGIEKMILELPSASHLRQFLATSRDKAASPRSVKHAKAQIEKAKTIVPRLRQSIQNQKSVFAYPGLLAKGDVRYDEDSRKYTLYIGVYLRPHEGREPFDLRVTFDSKGIIESVTDVVWKR